MSMLSLMGTGNKMVFTNQSDWDWNILAMNKSTWNESLPHEDLLATNDSELNLTLFGEQAEDVYEIDTIGYFLVILTLILVIVCWFCNAIVVVALNQLGDEKMKVNFLLKNAIVGDILLSITIAVRSIFVMAGLVEHIKAGIVAACVNVIYAFFGYFAVFYQLFTAMSVACDRFYSIFKPLKYHSMRYSKSAKVTIIAVILVLVTALSAPAVLVKLQPGKPLITICTDAYTDSFYSTFVLSYLILFFVFATLLIHCGVLCLIGYHRRVSRFTLGERNEDEKVRRRQTSLAITFFLIHITYVIMYIPAPIYFSFRPPNLKPNLDYYFTQITIISYLSNTVIDPLIYIFRIRSIRNSVRRMFFREQTKEFSDSLASQKTTI